MSLQNTAKRRSVHKCTSLYTAWARLGLLLEMNWHNASSFPRVAQGVPKQCTNLCTDLLFAVKAITTAQKYRSAKLQDIYTGIGSIITPTVVGVYRDWPGSSALNLYI